MKIDYKILWLDDQISEFDDLEYIIAVKEFLSNEGFNPQLFIFDKPEDFLDSFKKHSNIDLILTDYHISEEINGDNIIGQLRKDSIFTEVLFYTAKADLKDIIKNVNDLSNFNRVTFLETAGRGAHHRVVLDQTIELIKRTILKFHHIISMRGMIMHETSYLDKQMEDIVSKYIDNMDNKHTIKENVCLNISKFTNEKNKIVNDALAKKNYRKILKDNVLFSASQKADAVKAILVELDQMNFIDDYKKEIIKIRNDFAHAVLECDNNGVERFNNKENGIIFNQELCVKIRKDIIKHKSNLDFLDSKIT